MKNSKFSRIVRTCELKVCGLNFSFNGFQTHIKQFSRNFIRKRLHEKFSVLIIGNYVTLKIMLTSDYLKQSEN